MTLELPKFTKCCLCLPLRPGLLAWSYFKVVANAFIILLLGYFILTSLLISLYGTNKTQMVQALLLIAAIFILLILFITDFVFTIVFIVAGHKKNVSIVRGYYIYNIGVLVVVVLLIVMAVAIAIPRWRYNNTMYWINFGGYIITLVVQIYFTLLLRSQVIKLENSGEFRLANNSAEAQGMIVREKGTDAETV